MWKTICLFCLLLGNLIIFISAQNVIPPDVKERIDSLVNNLMETEHVPAFGLSIVKKNGDLLYSAGYGLRDPEKNLNADADTIFGIGSVTKSFTAIVVVKYLSETFTSFGESVLDVPIQILAPDYNFILGDNRQRYAPELCGFRDGFQYNNGLIGMAGHIVAHMANSTYDEMLSDLLNSIGMSDTTLVKETDDHDNMMHRAIPYLWKDNQRIRYNSELL
ncbi:Protein flp, partial [Folsomia candida]